MAKELTENQIQAAFFDWLAVHEKRFPELGLFYAIPNGANKSPAARGLFKRTGLKAGVPDVHLPVISDEYDERGREPRYKGLWVEFKAGRGKLSEAQEWWHKKLKYFEHRVEVCRSWTEAADITMDYLNLPLKRFGSNGSTG